jgi:hypothetical protein
MTIKLGDFVYIRHLDEVAVCTAVDDEQCFFWLPVEDNRGCRSWCCRIENCPEPIPQADADYLRSIADAIWRLEEELKQVRDRFLIASNLVRKEGRL